MDFRHLGWAGVQLRDGRSTIVIDPLEDAGAVWAGAGERARDVPLPDVVAAEPGASAGLVTHLHRDHADAAALFVALAPGSPVLGPVGVGGSMVEQAAVLEAGAELVAAGLEPRGLSVWERVEVDGWSITAIPAADGLGDPQVSWLVHRGDHTIVHAGDTLIHGWWWRVAERAEGSIDAAFLPVNGARVSFPHRRPPSPLRAAMNAHEAAVAAATMGARALVPIHYGAYHFPPVYVPDPDPLGELRDAELELELITPALGEWTALR